MVPKRAAMALRSRCAHHSAWDDSRIAGGFGRSAIEATSPEAHGARCSIRIEAAPESPADDAPVPAGRIGPGRNTGTDDFLTQHRAAQQYRCPSERKQIGVCRYLSGDLTFASWNLIGKFLRQLDSFRVVALGAWASLRLLRLRVRIPVSQPTTERVRLSGLPLTV